MKIESIFFGTKSIFSIDSSKSSNPFNVAFIEFKLKILFVGVEMIVSNDSKYFELESFISFRIWSVRVLDKFIWIFDDSNNSDDLDDSLDLLIFIRCIFTSNLDLLSFANVFSSSRSRGTILINLLITI